MGMAASQVRFLSLQNRKNTIGLNLMTLSNRKTALSRDMSRVANEYNNAMNQKVLKWSNDSGVTYHDFDYDTLMKPNALNSTLPYIITDAQGRVVIDDSTIPLEDGINSAVTYRDLAMMISSYSGHGSGKASYGNIDNLNGGSGYDSAKIAAITREDGSTKAGITERATSGRPNTTNEYQIVTNSVETVSNSLRYEVMEKLGLITTTEKNDILTLERKIYGSNDKTTGPYPVGSLMGNYYLAKSHLDAFNNLYQDGEYTFSADKNSTKITSDSFREAEYEAIDGSGTLNLKNTVNGGGTSISFNGLSGHIATETVDLTKKYNAETDAITELGYDNKNIEGAFNYTISGGKISYDYSPQTLIQEMGNVSITTSKEESGIGTKNDIRYFRIAGDADKKVEDKSWADLYNDNASISLYTKHQKRGGDSRHSYNYSETKELLTDLVTSMSDSFVNNGVVQIDTAAAEKAKISTIEFFMGDITNRCKSSNKNFGANNSSDKITKEAKKRAEENNLIGSANRNGSWIQGTDDYMVSDVNVRNLYNTYITFYDYYKNVPTATTEDVKKGATNGIPTTTTGTEKTDDASSSMVNLTNIKKLDAAGELHWGSKKEFKELVADPLPGDPDHKKEVTRYIREEATLPFKDEGFGTGNTIYKYLDASGAFIQYDLDEGDGEFTRFTNSGTYTATVKDGKSYTSYDPTKHGTGNSSNDILALTTKLTPSAPTADGDKTEDTPASNGYLILEYIDGNGNHIKTKIANSVDKCEREVTTYNEDGSVKDTTKLEGKDAYATTITGDVVDLRPQLEEKVAKAAAARDEALKELDNSFQNIEPKMMDYFDALFKMISTNGWVYDENVNSANKEASKNYLNAKLQNNMYFITEAETLDGEDFKYTTKLATNVSKVFQVYDTDAQNQALSKYESEKADITAKEKQVDIRMNKLETEQDVIKTELDSIKNIIKDNVDSTFKIFT